MQSYYINKSQEFNQLLCLYLLAQTFHFYQNQIFLWIITQINANIQNVTSGAQYRNPWFHYLPINKHKNTIIHRSNRNGRQNFRRTYNSLIPKSLLLINSWLIYTTKSTMMLQWMKWQKKRKIFQHKIPHPYSKMNKLLNMSRNYKIWSNNPHNMKIQDLMEDSTHKYCNIKNKINFSKINFQIQNYPYRIIHSMNQLSQQSQKWRIVSINSKFRTTYRKQNSLHKK